MHQIFQNTNGLLLENMVQIYVEPFLRAFRYWLWHCGVPAKLAFLRFK